MCSFRGTAHCYMVCTEPSTAGGIHIEPVPVKQNCHIQVLNAKKHERRIVKVQARKMEVGVENFLVSMYGLDFRFDPHFTAYFFVGCVPLCYENCAATHRMLRNTRAYVTKGGRSGTRSSHSTLDHEVIHTRRQPRRPVHCGHHFRRVRDAFFLLARILIRHCRLWGSAYIIFYSFLLSSS
jgi:hypothetical protein